jgi:DNA-directed RNA polymerase subunit alpha
MSGSLEMDIFVQAGRGYETIESRERNEKHEAGYIEIDSAFSPVLNVGINVENVRVGKMTNWDKLVLTITTDGTISVEDAFKQSTDILISQFEALSSIQKSEAKPAEVSEEE